MLSIFSRLLQIQHRTKYGSVLRTERAGRQYGRQCGTARGSRRISRFIRAFRKEVYVRVGALNWTGPADDSWLAAKAVHQHPLYNSNSAYDAEIIEIPPVDAIKHPPICLANFTEIPEEPAFVIGYGGHLNGMGLRKNRE